MFLGIWNSVPVAAKKLKDASQEAEFRKELSLLSAIGNHPNVVQFLGTYHQATDEYMIFEYCSKGSLLDFLRKYYNLPLETHLEM